MSRSRPASNPISYHKHTKQYYVTRGGKRIYLGSDKDQALKRYHRLGVGLEPVRRELAPPPYGTTVGDSRGWASCCEITVVRNDQWEVKGLWVF